MRNATLAYNHLYAAIDVPRDAKRLDAELREILVSSQAGDPTRVAAAVRNHISQKILHIMQVLETRKNTE